MNQAGAGANAHGNTGDASNTGDFAMHANQLSNTNNDQLLGLNALWGLNGLGGLGGNLNALNSLSWLNAGGLGQLQAGNQLNQMQQLLAQQQFMGLSNPLSNMTGLNQLGGQLNLNMLQGMNNQLGLLGLPGISNINALANLQNLQQGFLQQQNQNLNLQQLTADQNNASSGNPNQIKAQGPTQMKKRESKNATKIFQSFENKEASSNRIVPLAQMNSLISGQAPGGLVMGGTKMRKMTNEGAGSLGDGTPAPSKVDLKNLAQDLSGLCAKEYTRRISDNKFKELFPDYDRSNEEQAAKKLGNKVGSDALPKSPQVGLGQQQSSTMNPFAGLAAGNQSSG